MELNKSVIPLKRVKRVQFGILGPDEVVSDQSGQALSSEVDNQKNCTKLFFTIDILWPSRNACQ